MPLEPPSADLSPFVRLALQCVHREYPSKIAHLLRSDQDLGPPRALTPAFYGCFDWHSAVHAHWLLARSARCAPEAPWAADARAALATSIQPERIAGERRYLADRPAFERPYGLAWLLALDAELRRFDDPEAQRWAATLAPLSRIAADHLRAWLPLLSHPVRSGVHSQTAFALGLVLDWARATGEGAMASLVEARARHFFEGDRSYPLHLEPSGEDFLSPSLGAADLMRRIVAPDELSAWLTRALPDIPQGADGRWLAPVRPADPADGRLAHLDGLSLSRAWMLSRLAGALPDADPRIAALRAAAREHREVGLAAVTGEHYSGAHWLGTFAVYLLT